MQSVNLTQASIPLVFDYRNVREDQIVTWSRAFCRDVLSGQPVSLNKYLNFREAIYLPGTLDRIRAESAARRARVRLRPIAAGDLFPEVDQSQGQTARPLRVAAVDAAGSALGEKRDSRSPYF